MIICFCYLHSRKPYLLSLVIALVSFEVICLLNENPPFSKNARLLDISIFFSYLLLCQLGDYSSSWWTTVVRVFYFLALARTIICLLLLRLSFPGLTGQAKEKTDKRLIKSVCHLLAFRNFRRMWYSLTFPLGLMLVVFSSLIFFGCDFYTSPYIDYRKWTYSSSCTRLF